MKLASKYLALVAAIAGFAQTAQALPQLRLFDGSNTVTISDNGAGDSQPASGQVVWIGSIGNWTLNVHTGTTYPAVGTLAHPLLDLAFNATSNGGGTLWIMFAADDFGPTYGSATASIGGTLANGGSLTYETYGGTDNTNFSLVNMLTSQGPFAPVAFSGSTTGAAVNNAGPYALTQVVAITHGQATSLTTGNALLRVPESGTSILLLGAGLTGLALLGRLRRRFA